MNKIVWGTEAIALLPSSVWQRRLCQFVVLLERRLSKPQFDWNLYLNMPYMGQAALWGMETYEEKQLPLYAYANTKDTINLQRFFLCFLEVGAHVVKCWMLLQNKFVNSKVHFYNLIENENTIELFSYFVVNSYNSSLDFNQTNLLMAQIVNSIQNKFTIDARLVPYGNRKHHSDQRLYTKQELDESVHANQLLTRWLILTWSVQLMPHIKLSSNYKLIKSNWLPLSKSLSTSLKNKRWFELEQHEIEEQEDWKNIYRKALDPMISYGKSSATCSSVYSTYRFLLSEWTYKYNISMTLLEKIICSSTKFNIWYYLAQMICDRITKTNALSNYQEFWNWLEASIMNETSLN